MSQSSDAKSETLRCHGVLHTRPQDITDPLFCSHDFFDPRDLVQVKYEMLRRVAVAGSSAAGAAAAFGFSRSAFYQAQATYRMHGMPGLIPRRPGPRHPHKLSEKIMEFVLRQQSLDPTLW